MALGSSLRTVLSKDVTDTELETGASGTATGGNLLGFSISGAPTDGVDAVQLLTISGTPTGGSVVLTDGVVPASAIELSTLTGTQATAEAAVKSALEGLATIGSGNIASVSRSGSTPNFVFTVTFGGALAGMPQALIQVTNALTGGTSPAMTPTHSIAGVAGTHRGNAGPGALLQRTDAGNVGLYLNKGTIYKQSWKAVTVAS